MRHLKHYDDVAWLGFNSIAKDATLGPETVRAVVSLISLTDAKFLCR